MGRRQAALAIPAAVLAGGKGRRMGRDKATLPVAGVPLALRVAAAAATVAEPVVLVAPAGHPAGTLGLPVVNDPGTGPLAALAAALSALRSEHVLVLGCDHPGLVPDLLTLLLARRAGGSAVVCEHDGHLQGLVAVYERAPALAAASTLLAAGERSLRALLGALAVRVVREPEWREADPVGSSFMDVDHPADLQAWVGLQASAAGEPEGRPAPPGSPAIASVKRGAVMEEMLERVRELLGPAAPKVDEDEAEAVLELARVVAHSSERRAAPVTAYLVGMAVAGAAPEARVPFIEDLLIKLETQQPGG